MGRSFHILLMGLLAGSFTCASARTAPGHLHNPWTHSSPPGFTGCPRDGKTNNEKAFESANLELDVPMRTDIIFRLESITKQYTAIAILQLGGTGKNLATGLFAGIHQRLPYKGYPIPIENLLTHTSGTMDYDALDTFNPMTDWWRRDFKPSELMELFKNQISLVCEGRG